MKNKNLKTTTETNENEENHYNKEFFEERFPIVISYYKNKLKEARDNLKKYNKEVVSYSREISNLKREIGKHSHDGIIRIERLSRWIVSDESELSSAIGKIELYEREIMLYEDELKRLESAQIAVFEQNIYCMEVQVKAFSDGTLPLELDLAYVNGCLCQFELEYEVYTCEINRLNVYKESAEVSLGVRAWLFEEVRELEICLAEIIGFIKSYKLQAEVYKRDINIFKSW